MWWFVELIATISFFFKDYIFTCQTQGAQAGGGVKAEGEAGSEQGARHRAPAQDPRILTGAEGRGFAG